MANFSSSITRQILESTARAMFVCAWADREAEAGRTYPGEDISKLAPETSDEARLSAAAYIGHFESANGLSVEAIYAQACKADGVDFEKMCEVFRNDLCDDHPTLAEHPSAFGSCLGMMALGTGVSWTDDHERYDVSNGIETKPLKVPFMEFHIEPALVAKTLPKHRGPEQTGQEINR